MADETTKESLEITQPDIPIERPDFKQVLGSGYKEEDGYFDGLISAVDCRLREQYKKGRILGGDYANVYSAAMSDIIKESSNFALQREAVVAQAQMYKWQSEKFKQDAKLVTATELKLKVETANEVLRGKKIEQDILVAKQQVLKSKQEVKVLEQQVAKSIQEVKVLEQQVLNAIQQVLKTKQEIKLLKEQVNKVNADTALVRCNITKCKSEIDLLKAKTTEAEANATKLGADARLSDATKLKVDKEVEVLDIEKRLREAKVDEVKKNLDLMDSTIALNTARASLLDAQKTHEEAKKLLTDATETLVKAQKEHEDKKKLQTESNTHLLDAKKDESVKNLTVMDSVIKLNNSTADYNSARAELEKERLNVEKEKVKLMTAQIALEKAKLPLLCAQAKVEIYRAKTMAYDPALKKAEFLLKKALIGVKDAEVKIACSRATSERFKATLSKYEVYALIEKMKKANGERKLLLAQIQQVIAQATELLSRQGLTTAQTKLTEARTDTEKTAKALNEKRKDVLGEQIKGFGVDAAIRTNKLNTDLYMAAMSADSTGDGVEGYVMKGVPGYPGHKIGGAASTETTSTGSVTASTGNVVTPATTTVSEPTALDKLITKLSDAMDSTAGDTYTAPEVSFEVKDEDNPCTGGDENKDLKNLDLGSVKDVDIGADCPKFKDVTGEVVNPSSGTP